MAEIPTGSKRRYQAQMLLDEITINGYSHDGAVSAVAQELDLVATEMRQRMMALAQRLEQDAVTGEYAGGHYARDVLNDVALLIRKAIES